jgi:hypothetical protein
MNPVFISYFVNLSTPEKRPDWIASAEAELAAFKAESFEAKIGLGRSSTI